MLPVSRPRAGQPRWFVAVVWLGLVGAMLGGLGGLYMVGHVSLCAIGCDGGYEVGITVCRCLP